MMMAHDFKMWAAGMLYLLALAFFMAAVGVIVWIGLGMFTLTAALWLGA